MKKKNIVPTILWTAVILAAAVLLASQNSSSKASPDTISNNAQVSLSTDPDPLRLGSVNFIINVKDDKGNAVNNATVSFDLNMSTMNMGAQQGSAVSQGNGQYVATGRLSMAGPWRISTTVTMPDGKTLNNSFNENVR